MIWALILEESDFLITLKVQENEFQMDLRLTAFKVKNKNRGQNDTYIPPVSTYLYSKRAMVTFGVSGKKSQILKVLKISGYDNPFHKI